MRRLVVVLAACLLSAAASARLARDTRAALHGREPVADLLARHAPGRENVLIIFQPEDCLGDGTLVRRWNTLAASPALRVSGLVIGDGISPAERRRLTHNRLRMRLGAIPALDAALVAGMLGHTRTPFAVVLDERGRIAGSFPAGQSVPAPDLARLVAES